MIESDFSRQTGYMKTQILYNEFPHIDGLFCATDNIAIGAMQFFKDNNISIPEDIQLVGVGDSNSSDIVTPKLTTVHLHYKTSGIEAAKLLIQNIENVENLKSEVKMNYILVKRDTTL